MIAISVVGIVLSFFFGGAAGLPLSTPPLPPDPVIERAAPDECLLHLEMAGVAAPDAASKNLTEQLLANSDVQTFLKSLGRQIVGLANQTSPAPPEVTENLITLAHAALTRPMAVTVERFAPSQGPPDVAASLVIRVGNQRDDIAKAVTALSELALAGAPPNMKPEKVPFLGGTVDQLQSPAGLIAWGIADGTFVLTLGEGTIEGLSKRLGDAGRKAPAWKVGLRQKIPVARQSTLAYFNAGEVIAMATAAVRNDEKGMGAIKATGLSQLRTVGAISGMTTEETCTGLWIGFDGEPTGFFAKPASEVGRNQLARIPGIATSVQTWSLDPSKMLADFLGLVDIVDPRNAEGVREGMAAFRQATGLDLDADLLALLGSDWTVLSLPTSLGGPGGLVPNVALIAGIRDRERFEKTHDRLCELLPAATANGKATFTCEAVPFGSHLLHCVEITGGGLGIPLTPTWCLTDDALFLTLSPQTAKTLLTHDAKQGGIGAHPHVSEAIGGSEATFVGVLDPRPMLANLEGVYAFAVPYVTELLRERGLEFEIPKLPPSATISNYSRPSVSVIRHEQDGILVRSTGTIPFGPLASGATGIGVSPGPVGVLAGILLPAIQSARDAALRTAAMNNFKQVTIVFLMHEADKSVFPSQAICNKEGKPLLSWRVAILPYIGQDNLYKEFHLDEPWDSEHNKKLLARMPEVFAKPGATPQERAAGLTTMEVLTGPGTCFPKPDASLTIEGIKDGGSKTAALVESLPDSAVPWTKPEDLQFDPDKPLAGVGDPGRARGEFIAAFFDGHVQLLPSDIDPATFKAMVTPAGGEAVDP